MTPRLRLLLTTSLAFVICNMDKVNMSVAIIPMSQQYGWAATTSGLVQSSFFWGYTLSQLPGGALAQMLGGQRVLQAGVAVWSLATAAVPLVAGRVPALLFARLLVGLGEGVSPAAASNIIGITVPVTERSRAVSLVFGGLNAGTVIGLLIAPALIQWLNWEAVFYIFGALGLVWVLFLQAPAAPLLPTSPSLPPVHPTTPVPSLPVPWRRLVSQRMVWVMMFAHFANNWGHFCLLSWLPSYFSEELHVDLAHAALVALIPPLASVVISTFLAAPLADEMISRGVPVTRVRKMAQAVAFLSPAAAMAVVSVWTGLSPLAVTVLLCGGLGFSSFAFAGLYSTHADLSPKYAAPLLGLTSTVGALPGVVGVPLTGVLLDITNSWTWALFVPSIFFYIAGLTVWLLGANCQPIDFDASPDGAKVS